MSLYKKVLDYWNQHDGQEFETNSLKEFFTADELVVILGDNDFENLNYPVIRSFQHKIGWDRDNLFSSQDADRLFASFDRERFLEEVLMPISRGESVKAKRYDCKTNTFLSPVEYAPKKLTIIEGVYSLHPDLAPYYDASVFMSIDAVTQRERILKRNTPDLAQRFFNEWIPMENAYFEHYNLKNNCSIHLDGATINHNK